MSKVALRAFTEGDSATYLDWINTPSIMKGLDRVLPVTSLEHKKWYSNLIEDVSRLPFSVYLPDAQAQLGMVLLNNIDNRHRKAEVRIVIGNKIYQGKGYGKQTLLEISNFAFNKLGLSKLYAYILEGNEPSIKAFRGAEFIEEARLRKDRFIEGKFIDVLIVARWR